jgi:hypothetical protein
VIKIIAVLCSFSSPANCHEQTVTTSDFAEVSMQSCLMGAPQLAECLGASRRAPGGMALRDRQTGWQRSLGWKAASSRVRGRSDRRRVVNPSYSESDPTSTYHATGVASSWILAFQHLRCARKVARPAPTALAIFGKGQDYIAISIT